MGYTLPHPEAKPPRLDPANVPQEFRHLMPLAEKYGVADDGYRAALINSLNEIELRECVSVLESYDSLLNEWLVGPEASGPNFSKEYVVFSALGMAAEEAKVRLESKSTEQRHQRGQ